MVVLVDMNADRARGGQTAAGSASTQALRNSNVAENVTFSSVPLVVFGCDCLDRFLGHCD